MSSHSISSHLISWCHYVSSCYRVSWCHYMSSFHRVSSCHPMPSSHLMSWCHYMSSFHRMSRCHYMSSFHPVSSCHPMPPSHLRSWSHYTSSSRCQHMSSGHFAYRSMLFPYCNKAYTSPGTATRRQFIACHDVATFISSAHVMMSLHSSGHHMS